MIFQNHESIEQLLHHIIPVQLPAFTRIIPIINTLNQWGAFFGVTSSTCIQAHISERLNRRSYTQISLTFSLKHTHTHLHTYLPLIGISHHDTPALLVVLRYPHLSNILWSLNSQCLIDLIFLKQKRKSLEMSKQATCSDTSSQTL